MSGYYGFSMSNNAIEAYDDGEKPYSKWTKQDILAEIEDNELILECDIKLLKKLPVKALKEVALKWTSWHHTSSHYNRTDFYSLDYGRLENITDDEINNILADLKREKEQPVKEPEKEIWECLFLEWSGTRAHPKATRVIEVGEVRGDWFYRKDGTKKKTTANGFEFIKRIQ